MKKMIFALCVIALASCTKPKVDVQIDPNKAYTIRYKTDDQIVKTSVSNDTLHLNFNQKINFLLDPAEFQNTWSLYLKQDFSKSYLKDLHYNAIANSAGYAHDWVPIDLNTVAPGQKTISNVTVDGKQYVQITLVRVFEFYDVLASHDQAVAKQNALLQNNSDVVTYSAFYAYNNIYSMSSDASFKIGYTNQ